MTDPHPLIGVVEQQSKMLAEIVETLTHFGYRLDLLEAHSENLIERMRALEIFTDYDASLPPEPVEGWMNDLSTYDPNYPKPKARSIPSEEELEQRTRDASHGA